MITIVAALFIIARIIHSIILLLCLVSLNTVNTEPSASPLIIAKLLDMSLRMDNQTVWLHLYVKQIIAALWLGIVSKCTGMTQLL